MRLNPVMLKKSIFAGALLNAFVLPLACQADPVRTPPQIDRSVHCTYPVYPAHARKLNEQGVVAFELLVDPNGTVLDSRITSSSGSEELDKTSVSALSQCHFVPGKIDGQVDPEPVWAKMTWSWKMSNSR